MARIKLYQRNPAQQYVGVPQMDNSGAIIANAVASSANLLADQANKTEANNQYMARFMLNQASQDLGAAIRQKAKIDKAQDAVFQADADNRVTTDFQNQTNVASQQFTADAEFQSDPLSKAPLFEANRDNAIEAHLDNSGVTDPARRASLRPALRNIYERENTSVLDAAKHNATAEAPKQWVATADGIAQTIDNLSTAPWGTPEARAANDTFFRKQAQAIVDMKPGYAMSPQETRDLQATAYGKLARKYMTVVSEKDPKYLDAVENTPTIGKNGESTTLSSWVDAAVMDGIRSHAQAKIKYMDDQADQAAVFSVKSNAADRITLRSKTNPNSQDSVATFNNTIDMAMIDHEKNINTLRDQLAQAKTDDEKKQITRQLNAEYGMQKTDRGWQQTGRGMQKELDTARDRAAAAVTTQQKEQLAKENEKRAQAASIAYQQGNAHRVQTNEAMRLLPSLDLLRQDKYNFTQQQKDEINSRIEQLNTLFQTGIQKGYYSTNGAIPDGLANQMATVGAISKILNADDANKGAVNKWVDDQLKTNPWLININNWMTGTFGEQKPPILRANAATAYDPKSAAVAVMNDPELPNRIAERLSGMEKDLKAKGQSGLTSSEINKIISSMHAESVSKHQVKQIDLPQPLAQQPTERIQTKATKGAGSKSKSKNSSGLTPPPPPNTPSILPGGDRRTQLMQRISTMSDEEAGKILQGLQ